MSKWAIVVMSGLILIGSAILVMAGGRPVMPRPVTNNTPGDINRAIQEVYQRFGQYVSMGYAGITTLDGGQKTDTIVVTDRDGKVVHFRSRTKFAVVISLHRRTNGSQNAITEDSIGLDYPSGAQFPSDSSFSVTKKYAEGPTIHWIAMER